MSFVPDISSSSERRWIEKFRLASDSHTLFEVLESTEIEPVDIWVFILAYWTENNGRNVLPDVQFSYSDMVTLVV